jgi:hypothetical protein
MHERGQGGPVWKAPDNLLERVMSAVETGHAQGKPIPFFALPLPVRIAFIAGSLLVYFGGIGIVQVLFDFNITGTVALFWNNVYGGLERTLFYSNIMENFTDALFRHVPIMVFLVATGIFMAVIWMGTVAGFFFIVHNDSQRRTA